MAMRTVFRGLIVLLAALVAGCGGSPGFSKREDKVTISGVVARGSAMAGATVTVICRTNGGSTKTESDGSYSLEIIGATLPCVLQATPSANRLEVYRSLLLGSGRNGSFIANISPLTELVVALAAGEDPGAYISNFTARPAPSDATRDQALAALRELFAGQIDLAGLNPLTDELIAANAEDEGNPHDDRIEELMALLATVQTKLTQVVSAIATNPGALDPARTILAPPAATCSGLRSGKYRLVSPLETDAARKISMLTIDAPALSARDTDGTPLTLTADAGEPCRFTLQRAGQAHTMLVSPAGMFVLYPPTAASDASAVALGLPEQVLPVSALAGTWNEARWTPTSSPTPGRVASAGLSTLDSSGSVTAASACQGSTCTADASPRPRFSAQAVDAGVATSGGFEMHAGDAPIGRAFLFKNAAGKAVLVILTDGGDLRVATRQESIAVPGLFTANSTTAFREFELRGNGTASSLADDTVTVTAVDEAESLVTRRRASDNRVEQLTYNAPRDGLRYRAANACTISDVATPCPEVVQLPLQDTGLTLTLSVGTDPASAFFNLAVSKPSL